MTPKYRAQKERLLWRVRRSFREMRGCRSGDESRGFRESRLAGREPGVSVKCGVQQMQDAEFLRIGRLRSGTPRKEKRRGVTAAFKVKN